MLAVALVVLALAAVTAACSSSSPSASSGNGVDVGDPGNCLVVNLTMSTEKIDLLTSLAQAFNQTKAEVNGKCVFVSPHSLASGAAEQALADGWNTDGNNPAPVIWTPASSAWGAVLDQKLVAKGETAMANSGTPFMNTPLVIAMPQPMAEALGWPDKALGWSDILALATDQAGWAKYGHPEWGPFRLGKTNPNFSTSGLHALIAQKPLAATVAYCYGNGAGYGQPQQPPARAISRSRSHCSPCAPRQGITDKSHPCFCPMPCPHFSSSADRNREDRAWCDGSGCRPRKTLRSRPPRSSSLAPVSIVT